MGYDKQQAHHEFTRWSESYDRSILQRLLFGPSHRAIVRRLRQRWVDRPIRLLDVGCGTGVCAERVLEALPGSTVVGIDLVAGMLAKGRDRWDRHRGAISAVQGDSERLPFADATFDAVTCANSFHHYPQQRNALAEFRRVLRPGGHLLLIDGYRDRPWGWLIYDVCVAYVEGSVHHASAREMRGMCGEAGFDAVDQSIHRGAAPFLLTEAAAGGARPEVPVARAPMAGSTR